MDETDRVIVDFVFPQEAEAEKPKAKHKENPPKLGKCTNCGGEKYALASQMGGDPARGIPASRMFECIECGTYRLG